MKNKEITIYELMGLIKDDKEPEKIKYEDKIFKWAGCNYVANNEYFSDYIKGESDIDIPDIKVQILPEENDEWEDIEEIDDTGFMSIEDGLNLLRKWTNSLIKNQKYLKEKLEKK